MNFETKSEITPDQVRAQLLAKINESLLEIDQMDPRDQEDALHALLMIGKKALEVNEPFMTE